MKVTVYLLVFVAAASAQSSGSGCGAPAITTAGAAPAPAGSPAILRVNLAVKNGPADDPQPAPPAKERTQSAPVLAQIQPRRPFAVQPPIACVCGTVDASALTAAANAQEIPLLRGLSGNFRFEHVLVQEAKQFVATGVASLSVAVGRPGTGSELIPPFALMSALGPQNFWFDRPGPPQVTGTYDLIANFSAPSPLGNGAASNFTAGSVSWEICGYNVQ